MSVRRERLRAAGRGIAFVLGSLVATWALFLPIHWVHLRLVGTPVVLYACLFDGLLASLAYAGLYRGLLVERWPRTGIELGATTLAAFLLVSLYAVLVPTLVERSLSIYVLRSIDRRGGSVTREELESSIQGSYFEEMGVFDARIREQEVSGTLRLDGDRVVLTERGRLVVSLAELYRSTFLPDRGGRQ